MPFTGLAALKVSIEEFYTVPTILKISEPVIFDNEHSLYQYGIYLKRLHLMLSEVVPMMNQVGDLLHHQEHITNAVKRNQIQFTTRKLGKTMCEISACLGSVGHLYGALEMGAKPQDVKINYEKPTEMFENMFKMARQIEK